MRIVHLTSVHTWNDIRIFKKMASYLAQEDYEVHLVSLTRTGSTLEVMEVDGVNVHLVPYKSAKNDCYAQFLVQGKLFVMRAA